MINFKEWLDIQETGSPGFAVNRTAMPSRPYDVNPYSFSHSQISDPNQYLYSKITQPLRDLPHHALSQINQAYSSVKDVTSLNKTGVDGGGAAFVSPHSDDLSIWNWLWHKLNPSQNEILNRVTTHPILLGNDNSPVKKKMKLAENKVREVYTAHLLQLGLSIDPRNIVFVKQELRPGNMVVFVFGYKSKKDN
jgi:hypothetical protein